MPSLRVYPGQHRSRRMTQPWTGSRACGLGSQNHWSAADHQGVTKKRVLPSGSTLHLSGRRDLNPGPQHPDCCALAWLRYAPRPVDAHPNSEPTAAGRIPQICATVKCRVPSVIMMSSSSLTWSAGRRSSCRYRFQLWARGPARQYGALRGPRPSVPATGPPVRGRVYRPISLRPYPSAPRGEVE